jgi:anthranilate phosphoribosyltransferase
MFIHHNLAEQVPQPSVAEDDSDALAELFSGRALSTASAERLFGELVEGRLAEPAIAAMLVALRLKGETVDELIGAARALRAADSDFERPDYLFADSCGTGGDGSGSINISTAVAFVAAAAGLPVAKHGNRSFTSRCGSADVLERLGVRLDVPAEVSRRALDQAGICFLFAPLYHPGLRHAGPARRALKVRTIMNVLGPCLNPAEPPVQLLGVADASLLEPVARTLAALGTRQALVVHGAGLDEVALHADTEAMLVRDGELERRTITPEEAGLARFPVAAVKGGDPDENARRLSALLKGRGAAAETDSVALNAGALLMTAGLAPSLREGVAAAFDALASGEPYRRLQALAEVTNG